MLTSPDPLPMAASSSPIWKVEFPWPALLTVLLVKAAPPPHCLRPFSYHPAHRQGRAGQDPAPSTSCCPPSSSGWAKGLCYPWRRDSFSILLGLHRALDLVSPAHVMGRAEGPASQRRTLGGARPGGEAPSPAEAPMDAGRRLSKLPWTRDQTNSPPQQACRPCGNDLICPPTLCCGGS